MTDVTTGLPNQLHLQQHLSGIEAFRSLVVLCIGINRLQDIRKTHGVTISEDLLNRIGETINQHTPTSGFISHAGEGRFYIVSMNSEEDGQNLADQIIQAFVDTIFLDEQKFVVSVDIGMSRYPKDTVQSNDLIRLSEAAMDHISYSPDKISLSTVSK